MLHTTIKFAFLLIFTTFFSNSAGAQFESTPGFPKIIEAHVISGPRVIALPMEDRDAAIQLRILETYAHGIDFRYDIEYKGFEPGTHNLAEYLKREDGSDTPIDPIEVTIKSVLPEGQVEPHERPQRDARFGSYYLASLLVGGAIWLLGLFAILFAGRGRTFFPSRHQEIVTVADRLRPMVEKAKAGDLSTNEQAELERLLTAFWRKKLRLSHLPASQLIEQLRGHNEAGKLLGQLEQWLHAPNPDTNVDIGSLLEPYAEMSGDEI